MILTVSDWYSDEVCKIGQGAACCRYLVAGPTGLECMKVRPEDQAVIDADWGKEKTAQGDNCSGYDANEQP